MPTYNGTSGADNIQGSSGDDNISGLGGDDTLIGAAGNDFVLGGDGNDVLIGGNGVDTLIGGAGDDLLWGGGYSNLGFPVPDQVRDDLDGGDGDDSLLIGNLDVALGGAGDDLFEMEENGTSAYRATMDGGAGTDLAEFGFINYRAVVHLDPTTAPGEGFTLRNIEVVGLGDFGSRVFGGRADDVVIGGAGVDEIDGGAGDDLLAGGGGADILNGGAGSDLLDGEAGADAAVYAGVRRQYVASSTSVSGGQEGGTDTLVGIEGARFVDGTLTFDVNSQAAQIMRLYDAALDRQPDQGGFEGLLDQLETGRATIQSLAAAFIASPEFQARYGALTNQQFVEQLYRFCLDREGDAQGVAGWVNNLNNGLSRQDALVFFSESEEHRTLTAPTLARGLWVANDNALVIARLYDATFDRLADAGGLAGWTQNLTNGTPLLTIAAAFASSQEFQDRYGALSNQQFVEQMYRFCLNREGDPQGIAGWVANMDAGLSRAAVLLNFSESAEHVALTRDLWLGGIRTLDAPAAPTLDGGKAADQRPQVLIAQDDGGPGTPEVLPILFDLKLEEDVFVQPPAEDDTIPLVLPDGLDAGLLDLGVLARPTVPASPDRMATLSPFDADADPFDAAWARPDRDHSLH